MNAKLRTSPEGVALIKRHEGLRLRAYRDAVGVWTIGYGHTGADVHEGLEISHEQADALLVADIATAEAVIERALPPACVAQLRTRAWSALVSLVFNCGGQVFGNAKKRTGLYRALVAFHWPQVAHEIRRWVYAGGRILPGLVKRRHEEAALWESAWPTNVPEESGARPTESPPEQKPIVATKTGAGAVVTASSGLAAVGVAVDQIDVAQKITETASTASLLAQPGTWLAAVLALLIVGGAFWTLYGRAHVRKRTGQ